MFVIKKEIDPNKKKKYGDRSIERERKKERERERERESQSERERERERERVSVYAAACAPLGFSLPSIPCCFVRSVARACSYKRLADIFEAVFLPPSTFLQRSNKKV